MTPNTPAHNVPPVPQPKKKGLSVLAWIGIGCLGILVIGGVVTSVVVYYVANKVQEFAKEVEEDPVAAMATAFAAGNPDIELVATDKENRTVTFREISTGKELTFNYDDVENGRISFSSGGETAELQVTGDEGSGGLTVKTSEGTATFSAGSDGSDIPDWIPVFPETLPTNNFAAEADGQVTGTFTFTTGADVDSLLSYYDTEGTAVGLETKSRTATPDGAIWVASSPDDRRSLTVMASKADAGMEVVVSFTEKR
jgi:hypothetical protein